MPPSIYILRQYAGVPSLPGGTRHFNLARCMGRDGFRPFLFISNFHHNLRQKVRTVRGLWLRESLNGVELVWLNGHPYHANDTHRLWNIVEYTFKAMAAGLRTARQHGVPELIIGSTAHPFALVAAAALARRLHTRFWVDIGDMWPEGLVQAGSLRHDHPLAHVFRWTSDGCYRRAERIVVLTPKVKKYLIATRGLSRDRILVFPPGTDGPPAPFSPMVETEVKKGFRLTYTGSLNGIYPVHEVIEAVSRLRERGIGLRFDIIGDGHLKTELMTRAAELKNDAVSFHDSVAKDRLPEIYARSDLLILIEKAVGYGFPNKLIDYMAAARPIVIASDNRYGLPSDAFLQVPPRAGEIAGALADLTRMTLRQRREMGLKARDYGQAHHDMRANYQRWMRPLIHGLPVREGPSG